MTTGRPTPQEIREAIVQAAIRVVGRDGMASLTHRSVASEAQVSLSSTTYHFASKSAIVAAALTALASEERARADAAFMALRTAIADGVAGTVTAGALVDLLVHEIVAAPAARSRAQYELQLQAVDLAELQPLVRDWVDAIVRVMEEALTVLGSPRPAADARALVAATDGFRLDALTTPASAGRTAEVRESIAALVTAFIGGGR